MGEVLGVVSDADSEDFFKFYLHDFVRIVHKCYHSKKQEYETKEYEVRTYSCSTTNLLILFSLLQVLSVH